MTPPRQPPRPALHLAEHPPPTPRRSLDEVDQAAKVTAERVDALGSVVGVTAERVDALGSVVGMTAARVEVLTHDHDDTADETLRQVKAVRVDVAALARTTESLWIEVGSIKDGVLEAIEIGKRVESRQKADAAALRESSSNLERVTTDHSADIQRIRAIVAPLMAEASREGSARASRQVGAFGAVATTVAVVAPHIPWGEIGSAIARVVGG